MALTNLRTKNKLDENTRSKLANFIDDYSIEVMPRTAAKIRDFSSIIPKQTRVYIAHIEGVSIEEMILTAQNLSAEGFPVMPHFPARIIKDYSTLEKWIKMYKEEAGVEQALVLAGSSNKPLGNFESSMQLLESGLFDKYGFTNLHIAGHPEGSTDIDPDGTYKNVEEALKWKQKFSCRTNASMALVTQFSFDAKSIIKWADKIRLLGIDLPIHIGIAGPAKLQTLIKFALACGVGPSIKVLKKRALDVTKLLLPYEPLDILKELAVYKASNPNFNLTKVHFFPLGGIQATAEWAMRNSFSK